jgi:autotransporter-associated beta strand protein
VTLAVSNCPAGPAKYPLVTWTGTLSGTPPAGGLLGPHGEWNLVVEGNTLYLSITNNSQPLTWAANSQNWDTTSGNWVNAAMTRVSYQDSPAPGDWVVFEDTQSGSSPINVTMVTDVNPYGVIFSNTAKEYTLAGYSGIAGSTSLTKRGTNKVTLINGYNSYTGPTLVQQGTLQLGDGVLNGQVASVISVSNSASLVFSNATDQTHPPDIRGAGTLIKGAAGTLTLGASAGNDISGGQNVYDGTLLLNNTANTMSGAILVNGPSAKLKLASSGCIGSTAVGSGDVTLNNGATFQNDGGVAFTYLTANRKIIIGANGGRFTTADGSTPLTAVLLYSGQIAGATPGIGVLTYDGPGEFRTYSSHNTFGKLIVNGGRFTAGQSTSPAYNDSYGQIPAVLTPDAITIQNGSELRRAGAANVTLSVNQGITMGPGGGTIRVFDGNATLGASGLFAIPGPITGSGPLTLGTSADYWTNQLSGNNTFSGGVTLQNGTICVNSATALGAASSTITINPISLKPIIRNTSGGPITLANNNPQTWMGDFTFNGTSDLNLGTGAVTLSPVSGTAINVTNLANVLTVGGVISGSGMGLAKYGTATLMLTALNDYSGDTTISAGTLQLGDGTA